MGNGRFIAAKKAGFSSLKKSNEINLSDFSWGDLRSLASEKGVKVFGRGRAVIEKDLQEVLSRE